MLDQLQKGSERALWGHDQPQGSVIASDFYNASAIAEMNDQEIIDRLMGTSKNKRFAVLLRR
jgi:hypothetical protein